MQDHKSSSDMQEQQESFRYSALTNRGPPGCQHPPIESNREFRRYAEPQRGPKEAQYLSAAQRTSNAKPSPAGGATLIRGPQDIQDQSIGNKGGWASAAVGGAAMCAARNTGLGAADARSVGVPHE